MDTKVKLKRELPQTKLSRPLDELHNIPSHRIHPKLQVESEKISSFS